MNDEIERGAIALLHARFSTSDERIAEWQAANNSTWKAAVRDARAAIESLSPKGHSEASVDELWQPIETAPKDGTRFLAFAVGADNRPMHAIVSYVDPETMFSSAWVDPPPERKEIRGILGHKYGVEFTHWMPLPEPPALSNSVSGVKL
jgi:hypothetical protein